MQGDRERCLAVGMDAYVSKPVQAEELFAVIETLQAAGSEPEGPSPLRQETETVIDWPAGLEVADGDETLQAELLTIFATDAPQRMCTLGAALEAGEMVAIAQEVHTLKGAAAHIGARAVHRAALSLEQAAQHQNVRAVQVGYDQLAYELERLQAVLASSRAGREQG